MRRHFSHRTAIGLLFLFWSILSEAPSIAYDIRMNCGGPKVVAQDGSVYLEDRPYTPSRGAGHIGGDVGHALAPVGGTSDEAVYRDHRWGRFEYRFDLPDDSYVVRLGFVETWVHGPSLKIFNLYIEDRERLHHFDLFEQAGQHYAIDRAFSTRITDGQLNITLSPVASVPVIAGISIHSRSPDEVPPLPPRAFSARATYNAVILTWAQSNEDDLGGYTIYRADSPAGPYRRINTDFSLMTRYVDDSVEPGWTYTYTVRAIDVYGNESEDSPMQSARPFTVDHSTLPVYQLFIALSDLRVLNIDPWLDDYVDAAFIYEGVLYPVQVRYQGGTTRGLPKKSYKIKFKDRLFRGRRRTNLNAEYSDRSLMRERLSYDLFRAAGVLAPEARFVHLEVNGQFVGVYTEVDQVDELFLSRNGRSEQGNLYKCYGSLDPLPDLKSYMDLYPKKTNEAEGYEDLIHFIEQINETPDDRFEQVITRLLDIKAYIDWYAINTLIGNFDFPGKNYYLYHDPNTGLWTIIPWDHDLTFGHNYGSLGLFAPDAVYDNPINAGTRDAPKYGGVWNVLLTRILDVPRFRALYGQRLVELMNAPFSEGAMASKIDVAYEAIEEDGQLDLFKWGWEGNTAFRGGPQELKDFVRNRMAYLNTVLYDYTGISPAAIRVEEDVAPQTSIPRPSSLNQNYPNPFNTSTEIGYTIADNGHVRLCVYDLYGGLVKTLVDVHRTKGRHTVRWDGADEDGRSVASGVYVYQLKTGRTAWIKKCLLIR